MERIERKRYLDDLISLGKTDLIKGMALLQLAFMISC